MCVCMLHTCVCTHAHIHIGDRGQLAKRFSPSSMWVLQVEFMLSVLAVSTFTWWAVSPAQISIFLMLVDFLFHAFRVSLKGMGVLREDRHSTRWHLIVWLFYLFSFKGKCLYQFYSHPIPVGSTLGPGSSPSTLMPLNTYTEEADRCISH